MSKAESSSYFPVAQSARRNVPLPQIEVLTQSADMLEFAQRSRLLASPFDGCNPALPVDLRDAILFTCSRGESISEWRLSQFAMLHEISESLRPMSDRILARRPEHVAWACGPDVHPAFIAALVDALGSPDISLAAEVYLTGFPIVGQATETGLWRKRSTIEHRRFGPRTSVASFLASNLHFTQSLLHSLPKRFKAACSKSDADWLRLNEMTWRATLEEVNVKASARGPFTRSQMDAKFGYGRWRPIRRFGVPKGDGVRPCDDATQSGHNSTYVSNHVVANCPYDFPAAVARAFYDASLSFLSASPGLMGGAKEDVPNAYRTVPAATPELTIVALCHPVSGRVFFFETRGLNFGLAAAGENFVRLPTLLVMCARRLLAVPVDLFIDDAQIVESSLSRGRPVEGALSLDRFPGSAHSSFVSFCALTAFPLSIPKRVEWSPLPVGLGVRSDLSRAHIDGSISQRIAEPSRLKTLALIAAALRTNELRPSEAASLRGKLGHLFSRSLAARAALAPISSRQYQVAAPVGDSDRWCLSKELRGALHFVRDMLGGDLPDLIFFGPHSRGRPVVIFSDASFSPPIPPNIMGCGRVAFVVFEPGADRAFWAAADVPSAVMCRLHAFRQRLSQIIPLEAIALFSPIFAPELQSLLTEADILQFADNQTVNAIAVKNYASSPDIGRMLSAYSLRLARLKARSWVVYVPSALNIADSPSRPPRAGLPEFHDLLALRVALRRIDFVFPSAFSWTSF